MAFENEDQLRMPEVVPSPQETLGILAAGFNVLGKDTHFTRTFTPERYMALASPLLTELTAQTLKPGRAFPGPAAAGDGK